MLHAISGEGVKIMTLAEKNSTRGYYKYLYTFILRRPDLWITTPRLIRL